MDIIRHNANGKTYIYPAFQAQGFAAQFAFPFAKHLCNGVGLDIGYSKPEWKLPGAKGVEPSIDPTYHAMNLPRNEFDTFGKWDYIFSSHCLEHVKESWAQTLLYWREKLADNGTLFLYLPGPGQQYWKNWSNKKHVHNLKPEDLREFFEQTGWTNIFVSGEDLNNSFYAVAQKFAERENW